MKRKYEIGHTVIYKSEKWEIADCLNNTYALWQLDKNKKPIKELSGWIAENELIKEK